MQTTLLFLGLMTFPGNMLLGLGIMLAANEVPRIAQQFGLDSLSLIHISEPTRPNEVPRIAQQFGLDSSVKVNMMSVMHATTTAVNLTRTVTRAGK